MLEERNQAQQKSWRRPEECKPSKSECLKNFEINIKFLSIGCVVCVGCMSIPFKHINEAMDAIKEYTKNPYEERIRWHKIVNEIK